jgi:hypothetical protein
MAQDIGNTKKEGLNGIQNLTNTKDAIESLDKESKLGTLMSSLDILKGTGYLNNPFYH